MERSRRHLAYPILAVLVGGFLFVSSRSSAASAEELIVRLQTGVEIARNGTATEESLANIHRTFSVTDVEPLTLERAYLVRVPGGVRTTDLLNAYARSPAVVAVQANQRYEAFFTPNDPTYNLQWHFPKVNLPASWDRDTTAPLYGGDPSVVVAVVDTGVAFEQYGSYVQAPDFAQTTFVAGYDFINGDAHPNDDHGHGTHVAGTVAQSTNNGVGVAGVAFATAIMPVKVLGSSGVGTSATVAQGIDFARQNGADVINLSLGTASDDPLIHTAIQNARSAGIVIVAAAGNNNAATLSYPARYDEVISVAATRFDDARALYSNSGDGLDLSAPGGQLYVDAHYLTDPLNVTILDQNSDSQPDGILQQTCTSGACAAFSLYFYEGTSQATPHVAGAAALLLAAGASPTTVQTILQNSAQDLGAAGYDTTYGYGRLDIDVALSLITGDLTAPNTPTIVGYSASDQTTAIASNVANRHTTPSFTFTESTDSESGIAGFYVAWSQDASVDPLTAGIFQTAATYTPPALTASGTYTLAVRSLDNAQNVSARATFTFVLDLTPPAVPVDLQVSPSDASFRISWSAVADADVAQYRLEKRVGSGGFASLATTASTSVTDAALVPWETYAYAVRSIDALGNESAASTEVSRMYFPTTRILIGTHAGSAPQVRTLRENGEPIGQFFAYAREFRRGITVAAGDVDGDGKTEIVTGTRGASVAHVRIFSESGVLKGQFFAYPPSLRIGVTVAVGDLDGDGIDEIITAPNAGGGPNVKVFSNGGQTLQKSFLAYGASLRSGLTLATGDVNGDGTEEIITALVRGAPQVRIFDGQGVVKGQFFAYASSYRGTVEIAAADVDGDRIAEIITATGSGFAPHVRVFDRYGSVKGQFFAYATTYRGGVSLAAGDVNSDGRSEIITATGPGNPAHVRLFALNGSVVGQFFAFPREWKIGAVVAAAVFP